MYYLKSKKKDNKDKSTDDIDNKVFCQNHCNNMHKTVEQYKKQNVELQRQVEDLQLLVGERDAEVRDLAYKDPLPDQILRAQHALQALQDHLTERHMRQLLGSESLQAILGVICKQEPLQQQQKEQHNTKSYYVRVIDSMDPIAALQQDEQEKKEGDTTGGSVQQRAKEILAAMQQRKQQDRQQQQRQTTTRDDTNDNNDDNGREEDSTTRRRVEGLEELETPRRQGEDTTVAAEMAIAERQERGILQVRKMRRRRLVDATPTILACLSTVTTSLSHIVFTTLPFVAQQLQVESNCVSLNQCSNVDPVGFCSAGK